MATPMVDIVLRQLEGIATSCERSECEDARALGRALRVVIADATDDVPVEPAQMQNDNVVAHPSMTGSDPLAGADVDTPGVGESVSRISAGTAGLGVTITGGDDHVAYYGDNEDDEYGDYDEYDDDCYEDDEPVAVRLRLTLTDLAGDAFSADAGDDAATVLLDGLLGDSYRSISARELSEDGKVYTCEVEAGIDEVGLNPATGGHITAVSTETRDFRAELHRIDGDVDGADDPDAIEAIERFEVIYSGDQDPRTIDGDRIVALGEVPLSIFGQLRCDTNSGVVANPDGWTLTVTYTITEPAATTVESVLSNASIRPMPIAGIGQVGVRMNRLEDVA